MAERTRVTEQQERSAGDAAPITTEVAARQGTPERVPAAETVFRLKDLHVFYGNFLALRGVTLDIGRNEITAFIGPSGCGKSTLIRCLNRMNDLIPGARVEGSIEYHGQDLYGAEVDPVEVRRRIGMVFQKPNPFPKSIYDNIAYGPRVVGMKPANMDELVEQSLRGAAVWDEVKDKLKQDYTIVIVTHNMQQAARISDRTAFFTAEVGEGGGDRTGLLVEYDRTDLIFTSPRDTRTEDYVT